MSGWRLEAPSVMIAKLKCRAIPDSFNLGHCISASKLKMLRYVLVHALHTSFARGTGTGGDVTKN